MDGTIIETKLLAFLISQGIYEKRSVINTNKYFARKLDTNPEQIATSLKKLEQKRYIRMTYIGRRRLIKAGEELAENSTPQPEPNNLDNDNNLAQKIPSIIEDNRDKVSIKNDNTNKKIRTRLRLGNRWSRLRLRKGARPEYDILRFWNSFGKPLTLHRDAETKIVQRAFDEIKKILNRGEYSPEDIKESIRTYYKLISSPDTIISQRVPGHLVTLDEFFRFKNYTLSRMAKAGVDLEIKSWFDECLPYKDPLSKYLNTKKRFPDPNPKITEKFKQLYVERVLGGVVPSEWNDYSEVAFKKATFKLLSYFEKNGKKIDLTAIEKRYPTKLVRYVFDALENRGNGNMSKVTPGWLCSDAMYDRDLPAYFHEQAMIIG